MCIKMLLLLICKFYKLVFFRVFFFFFKFHQPLWANLFLPICCHHERGRSTASRGPGHRGPQRQPYVSRPFFPRARLSVGGREKGTVGGAKWEGVFLGGNCVGPRLRWRPLSLIKVPDASECSL